MYEVSKCAPQEALRDLDRAFANFFRRLTEGGKPGFPRFKSKKRGIGGFRLTGTIRVFERHIQLPRLGRIRLKERLELSERIFTCDLCGLEIDRDLNVALNLKDVAASDTETKNACGGDARPRVGRQTPKKQEPNAIVGDVLHG